MAQTATISSATGETGYEYCPVGTGSISIRGDITAGGVLVVVRPPGAAADYPDTLIDQTDIREVANEAADGYSYNVRFDAGVGASVALKANSSFAGNVTAQVAADAVKP